MAKFVDPICNRPISLADLASDLAQLHSLAQLLRKYTSQVDALRTVEGRIREIETEIGGAR